MNSKMDKEKIINIIKNDKNSNAEKVLMKFYLKDIVVSHFILKYSDNYNILEKVFQDDYLDKFIDKYFNIILIG